MVQESTISNLTIAVRHTVVVTERPINVLLNVWSVSGKVKFTVSKNQVNDHVNTEGIIHGLRATVNFLSNKRPG